MNPQELRRYKLHELAFDCLEAGDFDDFFKSVDELRQGDPNDPWIDHIDGYLFSGGGDQVEAIPILRRAAAVLPDHIEPKITLGIALMKNEQCDEAEDIFEKALAMEPDSFLALTNLACVLLARGENACPERAEEILRRADKMVPDDYAVWANLGHALALQNRKAEAHPVLLHAIELDQHGESCRRIAMIYPEFKDAANKRLAQLELSFSSLMNAASVNASAGTMLHSQSKSATITDNAQGSGAIVTAKPNIPLEPKIQESAMGFGALFKDFFNR